MGDSRSSARSNQISTTVFSKISFQILVAVTTTLLLLWVAGLLQPVPVIKEEPLKFFIAYRQRCSQELAGLVYFGLRHFGQQAFLDKESLGGGHVSKAIDQAIMDCDVFLLIADADTFQPRNVTVERDFVVEEVLLAHKQHKRILVVFHNNLVKFPTQLRFLNNLMGIKHSKYGPSNFIREILKYARQYYHHQDENPIDKLDLN